MTNEKTETLLYREGCTADIPRMVKLGLLSYGQYAGDMAPEHWAVMEKGLGQESRYTDLLTKGKGFVCECGGELVGMAFLVPRGNPMLIFLAEWAVIRMVGVNPAYGGRGIAQQLTRMCIEHARLTGETIIALHTSEMMDAARHIYEKNGFTKVREIDPLFGKRYWLYTLTL